jgi:SH3 domain protein
MNRMSWTLLLLALAAGARAETRYVTDRLMVDVYERPGAQGEAVAHLTSDTEVEVLEQVDGSVRLRTPDGEEGWLAADLLTAETPPRLQLAELADHIAQLEEALLAAKADAAAWAEVAQAAPSVAADARVTALEARIAAARAALRGESLDVQAVANALNPLPERRLFGLRLWEWLLIGLGVNLVVGLILGLALADWRHRRRHGGFRL